MSPKTVGPFGRLRALRFVGVPSLGINWLRRGACSEFHKGLEKVYVRGPLGFRVLGFRGLGFMGLGFRGLGV